MTTTSQTDMLSEVTKVDKDHYKRDIAYEFSNGRKFEDTDNTDSGIYDGK
jgi:hypothetical protein